jgi:acyl-CoA synthetase (AMP-forming)/AMP-acid ligase II
LLARWTALRDHLGTAAYERTLCLLPTHFGHGLICNCLFPWLSGQDLYLAPAFRQDVLLRLGEIVDRHRITFFSSVPSMWRLILRLARPPREGGPRRVSCGSAPLSGHLWRAIQEWSGTTDVLNCYGITETGSWCAGTTVAGFSPEDGLIGEPWGGVIRVLKTAGTDSPVEEQEECGAGETGHIWIRTPALLKGYFGREDLTQAAMRGGWFTTGDIGYVDGPGRLYLKGRERDEINKGGMKVHPADVEAAIEPCPVVNQVCCFAFEEPNLYGEDVAVALVLNRRENGALRELLDWSKARLARHQLPARWYVLEQIPSSGRGKVRRDEVARLCGALTPLSPGEMQ